MNKFLRILYLLWNLLIIFWNVSFAIRHYSDFDVETISAMIISIIFIYFIYKYFLNRPFENKDFAFYFIIGLIVIIVDIFVVFCIKFKGLSFG